jgi:hypothetical protein
MTNTEITFESRKLARTEQMLRELASQLADDVANGERTSEEANGIYDRAATRWMYE